MALTRASAAVVKTEELVNNRNLIINGAMQIAQRGTTSTSSSIGYVLDRFQGNVFNFGSPSFIDEQSTDAPDGFSNSRKITVATAGSLGGTNGRCQVRHHIEALTTRHLSWGTASAKTVTLSFWVKSSVTGNHALSLVAGNETYSYVTTYNIASANTWEYKTITVPGPTVGSWDPSTNAISIRINWDFGSGSNYTTSTTNSWVSGWFYNVSGAVSLGTTLNATWQITGVQLEVGSVATPFEHRPYGTELQLCQRYFYSMGGYSAYEQFFMVSSTNATDGRVVLFTPVPMRTRPTIIQSGSFQLCGGSTSLTGTFSAGVTMYASDVSTFAGNQNIGFDFWPGTAGSYGVTNAGCFIVRANNSTATRFQLSADL